MPALPLAEASPQSAPGTQTSPATSRPLVSLPGGINRWLPGGINRWPLRRVD